MRSHEAVEVTSNREVVVKQDNRSTKKFTFDRSFGQDSNQVTIYQSVVAPFIEEVLAGYNCTVFAYGQTGTGKTHTMIGEESPNVANSWDDVSRTFFMIVFFGRNKHCIFRTGLRSWNNSPGCHTSFRRATNHGR